MAITRLTGGLTPVDGSDPRTFPAIWNDAVDDIEAAESDIDTLENRLDTITTDEVVEGANLYYTDGRVQTVISNSTTDDVSEGATNLYFTDGRADARIAAATTDDLSEGATNLYYTDGRVETLIASSDTDDLAEGLMNLYHTDARASAAAPVQTVNTQTGAVVLGASDVGALPDNAQLGDLADVDDVGATDGQLIAYSAANDAWELASPAGITTADITALNLTWSDF